MDSTKGQVVRMGSGEGWGYDVGPHLKQASCKHTRAASEGACGGCYARAMDALQGIHDSPGDARAIVERVWAELRKDVPPSGSAKGRSA